MRPELSRRMRVGIRGGATLVDQRPSRRASRVQKRFLTAIFFHRGRRVIFERGDTRSAEGLGRNEPDRTFATLASCQYALALYVVKERLLFRPVNLPKTE